MSQKEIIIKNGRLIKDLMFKDNNIVCIIPARGGSKGIKNKNLVNILNKPLMAWTLEQAKSSKYIDNIYVSTDSEKIKMYVIDMI